MCAAIRLMVISALALGCHDASLRLRDFHDRDEVELGPEQDAGDSPVDAASPTSNASDGGEEDDAGDAATTQDGGPDADASEPPIEAGAQLRLVSSDPAADAIDVDPATKIRARFDRPLMTTARTSSTRRTSPSSNKGSWLK